MILNVAWRLGISSIASLFTQPDMMPLTTSAYMPACLPLSGLSYSPCQGQPKKSLRQKGLRVQLQAGMRHHRHHPDPPLPVLPCNIEAKAQSISLTNWHVACCIKCAWHKQWAHCAVVLARNDAGLGPADVEG